jgi:hypothetical protein
MNEHMKDRMRMMNMLQNMHGMGGTTGSNAIKDKGQNTSLQK